MSQNVKQHVWKNYFSMLFKAGLPWVLLVVCFLLSLGAAQIALVFAEKVGTAMAWSEDLSLVVPKLWELLILGILGLVCYVGGAHLKGIAIAVVDRNVQRYAVKKVFALKTSDYEGQDTRALISRLTDDTAKTSNFLIEIFVNEIPRIYYVISALIKVCAMNQPTLTWTLLLAIPVTILFSFISGVITFRNRNKIQANISKVTARLAEKVENVEIIKSYNNEEKEINDGNKVIDELDKVKKTGVTIDKVNKLTNHLTWLAQFCIIIIPPAVLKFQGKIELSDYLTYIMIAASFITYVREHLDAWISLKEAQGATLRLSAILSLEDENSLNNENVVPGNIEFNNVSFAYGEKQVLNNVSFVIEKGKKTALVGLSGSGKSTILNLIEKFYAPTNGIISINGKNINELDYKNYRNNFAYLPQNAPGLKGTVREMFEYSRNNRYSDEQIIETLKRVGLYEDIEALGGLDYDIGFNGENLSGGQKQKLGIARLLLSECEYVLLDEATSALDVNATNKVQKELDEAYKNRTQIIVSHDLSTVENADNILVFEDGKLIAFGKHNELLESNAYYCQLVKVGE